MEHVWAYPAGTLFRGHRGNRFAKVIQITTNRQLSLVVKVPENSECELTVRARNSIVEAPVYRTLTVLWVNFAQPDPSIPNAGAPDIHTYLQDAVHDQMPQVLVITSTGSAFNAGNIKPTMESVGNTVAYKENVGLDRGVCCASFTPEGHMWQDMDRGNSIQSGVVLHYNWF